MTRWKKLVPLLQKMLKLKPLKHKKIQELWDTVKRPNRKSRKNSSQKHRKYVYQITEKNFTNLKKEIHIKAQEAYRKNFKSYKGKRSSNLIKVKLLEYYLVIQWRF